VFVIEDGGIYRSNFFLARFALRADIIVQKYEYAVSALLKFCCSCAEFG